MKNFIILMFLSLSISVFAQIDTISPIEVEMINQINTLRSNPKSYIPHLDRYIKERNKFLTVNEVSNVNNVIKILNKTKPLSVLMKCDYMDTVTKNHLKILNLEDKFCVECASDGTLDNRFKHLKIKYVGENLITSGEPIDVLLFSLLFESNRKTLLHPKWRFISVAMDDDILIQDFAY